MNRADDPINPTTWRPDCTKRAKEADTSSSNSNSSGQGISLPVNLMKSLRQKNNQSEGGSSNIESNSDNSGLVSFGNTSFGFNFEDSEGGISNSPDQSDSDGNGPMDSKVASLTCDQRNDANGSRTAQHARENERTQRNQIASSNSTAEAFHDIAAEAAVAELHSIALTAIPTEGQRIEDCKEESLNSSGKRSRDNDSSGYNSDDEGPRVDNGSVHQQDKPEEASSSSAAAPSKSSDCSVDDPRQKKKKRLDDKKREERNAREKERSFRISKQINELRNLLSSGGVIVPKGTKSSVLTETANYIRMLQQHQYRSEIDRQQLVQQIQMIGGGAHGPQAAAAIRHVAAQNGVIALDNFAGPPSIKSAVQFLQQPSNGASGVQSMQSSQSAQTSQQESQPLQQTKIEDHEYRSVFNNCSVGMAIASMGGAFIDCNTLFCKLSNYTKQEVCALTIFNLTARQDLQHAFDLISQLISPSMDNRSQASPQPVVLRGAMNNGNDLGLSVTLVKAEDGIAKCFCVTLIKNPASPFDDTRPIPATIELVHGAPTLTRQQTNKDACTASLESTPAFTSG